jgi:hypothetical protein
MKHIIATIALLSAGTASAMSGNTLLQSLNASGSDKSIAIGFIAGVSSGLQIGGIACFPEGATVGQNMDIVKRALESNPSVRHEEAGILAMGALMTVFPCKKPAKAAPSNL